MSTETPVQPVDGQQMLSLVSAFIHQYLVCTEDQLAILALWVLHTHCFLNAAVTPYLHISSRERESGKTLCIELLSLLCMGPWLTSGFTPAILLRKLQDEQYFTVLLDDCDSVFAHSKSVVILGLLNRGFGREGAYSIPASESGGMTVAEVEVFCPKAFAGMRPLPSSIQGFCIPMKLEPKEFGAPVKRFNMEEAREAGEPLALSLYQWSVENKDQLEAAASYRENQLPQELSPRQQDCAEPLLQLADIIGGEWPARARRALVHLYAADDEEEASFFDDLLLDIRDAFASKGDPAHIPTGYTLAYLHGLSGRPWNTWRPDDKPMDALDLARILSVKGIRSCNKRVALNQVVKGYRRKDFLRWWQKLPKPKVDAYVTL